MIHLFIHVKNNQLSIEFNWNRLVRRQWAGVVIVVVIHPGLFNQLHSVTPITITVNITIITICFSFKVQSKQLNFNDFLLVKFFISINSINWVKWYDDNDMMSNSQWQFLAVVAVGILWEKAVLQLEYSLW